MHSLPDMRRHLTLGVYDIVEAVTGSDHRPVALTMRLFVQPSMYGFDILDEPSSTIVPASIYHCELALSQLQIEILNSAGGRKAEQGIRQITIHYPLVSEDPLAPKRKSSSLYEVLNGESDMVSSSGRRKNTIPEGCLPSRDAGMPPSPPTADMNLKNHFSFSWSSATGLRGNGLSFATLAAVQVSNHALIKLLDKENNDVGQAVVCLR